MASMHPIMCLETRSAVVKRSDDLAGTSFGRKVDSSPSSCKTRVMKTSVTVSFAVHVDRYAASSSPCFAML
eukprot:scaffold78254_cov31-Attheya_sp.AAC.1